MPGSAGSAGRKPKEASRIRKECARLPTIGRPAQSEDEHVALILNHWVLTSRNTGIWADAPGARSQACAALGVAGPGRGISVSLSGGSGRRFRPPSPSPRAPGIAVRGGEEAHEPRPPAGPEATPGRRFRQRRERPGEHGGDDSGPAGPITPVHGYAESPSVRRVGLPASAHRCTSPPGRCIRPDGGEREPGVAVQGSPPATSCGRSRSRGENFTHLFGPRKPSAL